jgi:PleD family two-component response regulator
LLHFLETFLLLYRNSKIVDLPPENIEHMATIDPLTGAFNRHRFLQVSRQELKRAKRYNHPLSLFMMDLDHYKDINDTHGHLVGDALLLYGGDEFLVLMPETNLKAAYQTADRIRHLIEKTPLVISPQDTTHITVSIGLTSADPVTETGNSYLMALIHQADQAFFRPRNAAVTISRPGREKSNKPRFSYHPALYM